MIFADVKSLSVPEGAVLRILNGDEVLWTKHTGLLPAEYQQVEYIHTDGTSYIDTGVNASDHPDGITYKMHSYATKILSSSNNNWYFGALESGKRSGNFTYRAGSAVLFVSAYSGYVLSMTATALNVDVEIEVFCTSLSPSTATATWNGTALSRNNNGQACEMPDANIHLMRCNGASTGSWFCGRVYSFTMDKPDGTPIRNYVPCYRKADGEPGMYDTVEGKFYTNAGTGSFTVGPDV